MLSQLNRHETAHVHCHDAVKLADKIILATYKLCREHLPVPAHSKKVTEAATISSPGLETALKVFPTLRDLAARLGPKGVAAKAPARKLELRTVLGVHHFDHWIYAYNIGQLMVISPISVAELRRETTVAEELSSDSVLDSICLSVIANFCVAAETRFLSERNRARQWHSRALSLAFSFLPAECPLSRHVRQSYQRNYPERRSTSPSSRKPMLKTFDFSGTRGVGFRSPKGATAEDIVGQIIAGEKVLAAGKKKLRPMKRANSVRRCSSSKRTEASKAVECTATTIPTEGSDGQSDQREVSRSVHWDTASPAGHRASLRKVNVSILTFGDDDLHAALQEGSSGDSKSLRDNEDQEEEEIVLTSSVLYGENIGAEVDHRLTAYKGKPEKGGRL